MDILGREFLLKMVFSVADDTSIDEDRYRLCKADRDILHLFGTSRVTLGARNLL
jgi:hypothetical protein